MFDDAAVLIMRLFFRINARLVHHSQAFTRMLVQALYP
jgi:hypothetical protein